MLSQFASALVMTTVVAVTAHTQQPPPSGIPPIGVPLTMVDTALGTYKADLQVGIGSLQPLSMPLDTGSVGLVVFAVPGIPGNGTACSTKEFSVTYGNPARVTYSGVICYGQTSLAGIISTPTIPFALLTSTTFCAQGFQCKTPQQNYEHGIYGVFGAGLSTGRELPNPLRTLNGTYGKRFMLRLSGRIGGDSALILGPAWRNDAAIFPQGEQSIGALKLPVYEKGRGCVLLNGRQASVCPLVSFDTGNGVPWFHAYIPHLQTVTVSNGNTYVAPGTTVGLSPRMGGPSAFTLMATDQFAGEFRYEDQSSDLINVSIQAFVGNDVIYDGEEGVITVAPTPGN